MCESQEEVMLQRQLSNLRSALAEKDKELLDAQTKLAQNTTMFTAEQRGLEQDRCQGDVLDMLCEAQRQEQETQIGREVPDSYAEFTALADEKSEEITQLRDVLEELNEELYEIRAQRERLVTQITEREGQIDEQSARIKAGLAQLQEVSSKVSKQSQYLQEFAQVYHPDDKDSGAFAQLVQTAEWLKRSVERTLRHNQQVESSAAAGASGAAAAKEGSGSRASNSVTWGPEMLMEQTRKPEPSSGSTPGPDRTETNGPTDTTCDMFEDFGIEDGETDRKMCEQSSSAATTQPEKQKSHTTADSSRMPAKFAAGRDYWYSEGSVTVRNNIICSIM